MVRLRFFARYAELVGTGGAGAGAPAARDGRGRRAPRAGESARARPQLPERPLTAVNLRHVRLDAPVAGRGRSGIPAAAGGRLRCRQDTPTREPISPAALLAEVAGPDCGATCLFLGTVRDGPEDGGVTGDRVHGVRGDGGGGARPHHRPRRAAQWPAARLAVRHRLGLVATEEASIGIAAAAPHRAEAFAACRYVIEEVKQRLPVWKKELRADGSVLWVDPQGRPAVVGPE